MSAIFYGHRPFGAAFQGVKVASNRRLCFDRVGNVEDGWMGTSTSNARSIPFARSPRMPSPPDSKPLVECICSTIDLDA
jgi:hypothetical protein